MAKYKVLVIAMTVKNNQVAKSGQIVDDSQLNTSAFELINAGFIEVVEEEKEVEKVKIPKLEDKPKK